MGDVTPQSTTSASTLSDRYPNPLPCVLRPAVRPCPAPLDHRARRGSGRDKRPVLGHPAPDAVEVDCGLARGRFLGNYCIQGGVAGATDESEYNRSPQR